MFVEGNHQIVLIRSSGCTNEKIDKGRSYELVKVDISNCFFERTMSYDSRGGVIYVSENTLSVIDSMFLSCSSSNEGGAIFASSELATVLSRICAFQCNSQSGHFAFIGTKSVSMDFVSLSSCSMYSNQHYSIHLNGGSQKIDFLNSSQNHAYQGAGFGLAGATSFKCSFCTFSNNYVSYSSSLLLHMNSGNVSYCNLIHNNSPAEAVIQVSGTYSFTFCVFDSNHDILFILKTGSLSISHSFIHHPGNLSTSGAISTDINNSFSSAPTYNIQYFQSHFCNADNPLPKQTPESTPQVTLDQPPSIEEGGSSPLIAIMVAVVILGVAAGYALFYFKIIAFRSSESSQSEKNVDSVENPEKNN